MNRFLYPASLLCFVSFTECQLEKHTGSSVSEPGKPNILFILTDDLRADALNCAGNSIIKTPNIDYLASNGIRFTNCYVMGSHQQAVSAPSRAMLMSGKSLFHVYGNLEKVTTMPMHFASNGYETFGTGKWHNTAKSFEASFQNGKNVFLDGMSNHFRVPCQDMNPKGKLSGPMNKGYSTDLFAEAALEFLQDYIENPTEKPFFCFLSFTAPHDPRSPREDFIGMYKDEDMQLPENYMELHPFEFDDLNGRDETLAPWPRTPWHVKATLADYYALISHMDKRIGDVLDLLKSSGLLANTVIVFTSDNGLAVGSHGLLGKQNLYEHSVKVPLIIMGKDVPKGKVTDAMVYLFDIFPTLSSLCRLPEPEGIDGENLYPVILEKAEEVRSSVYLGYSNTIRAVREENWKLIWYMQRKHIQLFDLDHDPDEIQNLAGIPENKGRILKMMDLIAKWHASTADTATLFPTVTLPMEYDHTKLKQVPDPYQPEYVLEKFFPR